MNSFYCYIIHLQLDTEQIKRENTVGDHSLKLAAFRVLHKG